MNLPTKFLRGPEWAKAPLEARSAWALIQIAEQLNGNPDGWIAKTELILRTNLRLKTAEASGLFEFRGELLRPRGYPVGSVARVRALSESAKKRNSQLLGTRRKKRSKATHSERVNTGSQLLETAQLQVLETTLKNGAEHIRSEEDSAGLQVLEGVQKQICSTQEKEYIYTKSIQGTEEPRDSESTLGNSPSWRIRGLKGEKEERSKILPGWVQALSFPTSEGSEAEITPEEWENLRSCFSEGLLHTELPLAAFWLRTNPKRRKTRGGLLRFLGGWMQRSKVRQAQNDQQTPGTGKKKRRDEWEGVWRVGK